MSEKNPESPEETGVILLEDSGVDLNLGFISNGAIFYFEWDEALAAGLSSLIIVDSNISRTLENTRRAFERGVQFVTIIWNAARYKLFSFSVISFIREFDYRRIEIIGSTAHLQLSNVTDLRECLMVCV